jgi:hypothetical protein
LVVGAVPLAKNLEGLGGCRVHASCDCNPVNIKFPVSSTWSQVIVKWDAFSPGSANGSSVTTPGKDITALTWNVGLAYASAGGDAGYTPVAASYSLSIDDVQFMASATCSGGSELCGTSCIDTKTDSANCGGCGMACSGAHTCSGGSCVCPSNTTECNGECVDTQTDAQNCGACDKNCSGVCSGGTYQASTCTANMPQKDKTSTAGDAMVLGKYWINNNQWGAKNATGSQSVWDTCLSGNTIGWGTEWSWSGGSGVISYASAVLGWHYGWKINNTGLPVQLSDNKTITCGWTYRVQKGQTMNVSYDLFAHTQSNPTGSNDPSDKIMLWLTQAGGPGPIGDTKATVNLGGASWDLHQGSNGYWNVYTYVRTGNADTGATLNLSDFLNDLTANRGLAKTKYLTSIQAGTEVSQGSGRLDTDQYYGTIQ